jgi:hypothetical protein
VGHYHLMDVEVLEGRGLPDLLQAVRTAGFLGVNVTHPFKEEVITFLDEVSVEAAQIGAVNTVAIDPTGRTTGTTQTASALAARSWKYSGGRRLAEKSSFLSEQAAPAVPSRLRSWISEPPVCSFTTPNRRAQPLSVRASPSGSATVAAGLRPILRLRSRRRPGSSMRRRWGCWDIPGCRCKPT